MGVGAANLPEEHINGGLYRQCGLWDYARSESFSSARDTAIYTINHFTYITALQCRKPAIVCMGHIYTACIYHSRFNGYNIVRRILNADYKQLNADLESVI